MAWDLEVNIDEALADLDAIDRQVPAQVESYLAVTAHRYQAQATSQTPVGPARPKRRPLVTGWQTRQRGPFRFHVVNVRPHAHLVEAGFTHVSGRPVSGIRTFVPLAQAMRETLARDLERAVGPNLRGSLRVLEVVP